VTPFPCGTCSFLAVLNKNDEYLRIDIPQSSIVIRLKEELFVPKTSVIDLPVIQKGIQTAMYVQTDKVYEPICEFPLHK
jgi:hypothetical protein